MIKLNFKYQGEPFQQAQVAEAWRQHPAQLADLLSRLAKDEPMAGEVVVHYGTQGPTSVQIKSLTGVAPEKLGKLFSTMGFGRA